MSRINPSNPPAGNNAVKMRNDEVQEMTKLKVKKSDDVKESFRERIADLLEEMWDKIGQHHHGLYATPGKMRGPDTDLSESGGNLTYRLELPGMADRDIEVETAPGRLTIRGEKKDERKKEGENYIFRERRYGSFERRFPLPEGARPAKASAEFEDGVLTVTVPCDPVETGETTRIEIK